MTFCESKHIDNVRAVDVKLCNDRSDGEGQNIPGCTFPSVVAVTCPDGYKPTGGLPDAKNPQTQNIFCNSDTGQWNDFSCELEEDGPNSFPLAQCKNTDRTVPNAEKIRIFGSVYDCSTQYENVFLDYDLIPSEWNAESMVSACSNSETTAYAKVTCKKGYRPIGGSSAVPASLQNVATNDARSAFMECTDEGWESIQCEMDPGYVHPPSTISASTHITCENRTDGVKCWGVYDHDLGSGMGGRTVIRVQPDPESVRVVHFGDISKGSPVDEKTCKSIHRTLNRGGKDKYYITINDPDYPQGCSARYFQDDIFLQYNNATTGKPNASATPITESFLPEQKAFYQFEYFGMSRHKTSYAIGKDGTVLAWGSNRHGALGYLPVKAVDGTCPDNYKKFWVDTDENVHKLRYECPPEKPYAEKYDKNTVCRDRPFEECTDENGMWLWDNNGKRLCKEIWLSHNAGIKMSEMYPEGPHDQEPHYVCVPDSTEYPSKYTTPREVPALKGDNVKKVAFSKTHQCFLLENGTVKCWGKPSDWALETPKRGYKIPVVNSSLLTNAVDVDVSSYGTCAATTEGEVKCWDHFMGSPVDVANMERAVRVYMGRPKRGGCAIDNTGDLWCWNDDNFARKKQGLSNIADVAMTRHHTCALDRSGKVFCFGSIHSAALPNPSTSEYKVTDIVAEDDSGRICGKTEEGPIVCWGGYSAMRKPITHASQRGYYTT